MSVKWRNTCSSVRNHMRRTLYKITFWRELLLWGAFIALAVNLRAPLTSLPSVINDVKTNLHISSGVAGLLTTIPVLCFGVLTPVASIILSRVSVERAIFLTLFGVVFGTLIRSGNGLIFVLSGTFILGASLTLGNIVSLMVIARDFHRRSNFMTGVYVMSMGIGAMLTAALSAPLASIVGWRVALAAWSVLAIFAIVLWMGVNCTRGNPSDSRSHRQGNPAPSSSIINSHPVRAVWHNPAINLLAIAFASHTFIFYAMTAWLPDCLMQTVDMNSDQAGVAASCFQFLGILGCFGIPWLRTNANFSPAKLFFIVGGAWFFMPAGLLVAPHLWAIWMILGGIGAGGGFLVVFMLVMAQAGSLDENRRISSFVQGIGYVIASTGPTVVGFFHQVSGKWFGGFFLLSCIALLIIVTGVGAAKCQR